MYTAAARETEATNNELLWILLRRAFARFCVALQSTGLRQYVEDTLASLRHVPRLLCRFRKTNFVHPETVCESYLSTTFWAIHASG